MKIPNTKFSRDACNGRMGGFIILQNIFLEFVSRRRVEKLRHVAISRVDILRYFHSNCFFVRNSKRLKINSVTQTVDDTQRWRTCWPIGAKLKWYLPVRSVAAPVPPGEVNEKSAAGYPVLQCWVLCGVFEESVNHINSLWGGWK
jgi:hypothetical protein